jgi:glycerate kinase
MRILVAPDKFKGSLSAMEVCEAVQEGIFMAHPEAEISLLPLADGGDGTAAILTHQLGGGIIAVSVSDPLFRTVQARYGISADGSTAYIEMAEASGLRLLQEQDHNCYHTTTKGTGELILDAIRRGVKKIILGIGGSATNDAGIGMAVALGYRFLDAKGRSVQPIGKNLHLIHSIDDSKLHFDPNKVEIQVACDVTNPLSGPAGAAWVYGPQKGAKPAELEKLDHGLKIFAEVVEKKYGIQVDQMPGAGAAGGMGAGAVVFLKAKLSRGIDLVMEQTKFESRLKDIDLVITGEGKIDEQTINGKVVSGVCKRAQAYNIPVAAICGALEADPEMLQQIGLCYATSIICKPTTLDDSLRMAYLGVRQAAYNMASLFGAGCNAKKSILKVKC